MRWTARQRPRGRRRGRDRRRGVARPLHRVSRPTLCANAGPPSAPRRSPASGSREVTLHRLGAPDQGCADRVDEIAAALRGHPRAAATSSSPRRSPTATPITSPSPHAARRRPAAPWRRCGWRRRGRSSTAPPTARRRRWSSTTTRGRPSSTPSRLPLAARGARPRSRRRPGRPPARARRDADAGRAVPRRRRSDVSETPASYFEERWAPFRRPVGPRRALVRDAQVRPHRRRPARPRYRHAVEPACGVGLLTARLAARADAVTASDRFAGAVADRDGACAALAHVDVRLRRRPRRPARRRRTTSPCSARSSTTSTPRPLPTSCGGGTAAAQPGGHVALVHHRPAVAEHVLDGDDVHAIARRPPRPAAWSSSSTPCSGSTSTPLAHR